MREWLSGGAPPCQGGGRGFDSRLALSEKKKTCKMHVFFFFEAHPCLEVRFARFYERCKDAPNWLPGACSRADMFECRLIARQRDSRRSRIPWRLLRPARLSLRFAPVRAFRRPLDVVRRLALFCETIQRRATSPTRSFKPPLRSGPRNADVPRTSCAVSRFFARRSREERPRGWAPRSYWELAS